MLFYTVVIARALATGRTAGCNCFGSESNAPVSRYTLVRNVALLLAADYKPAEVDVRRAPRVSMRISRKRRGL